MSPEGTDLVLATDGPDGEGDVFVFNRLDIEAYRSFDRDQYGTRPKKGGKAPMVGMVVTISPSFSLYRMVVLPAASRPTYSESRKSSYNIEPWRIYTP